MEKYLEILKKSTLFAGLTDDEILSIQSCINARVKNYKKGEYVFSTGDRINSINILVKGVLHIRNDDFWGNSSIMNVISEGEMFGEAYAGREHEIIMNDVVAIENSTVIFYDVNSMLTTCNANCKFHSEIIQNLLFAISEKNRLLVQKLGHTSKRTTKGKLMSYLSLQAAKNNSNSFTIPFNRQQLADFLYVDRSAMSNELCKMRDEGLILFEKNKFTLL